MKTPPVFKTAVLLSSVGAAFLATTAQAQFNAARGNMLWGAREVNADVRGGTDFVVDLGAYTRFTSGSTALLLGGSHASESYQGLGPASLSENRFAASDILATFGNLDNVFSSAFAVDSGASPTANSAYFLTRARTDINVQSDAWERNTSFAQSQTGNKMETIRNNAINAGADINNTSTRENTAIGGAYGNAANSPFAGYDEMEANTGAGFAGNAVVRMDLYGLPPGSGELGDFLGYFELQADGDLWFIPENFVPVPEASSYGIVAGAGLLLLALRRRMTLRTA